MIFFPLEKHFNANKFISATSVNTRFHSSLHFKKDKNDIRDIIIDYFSVIVLKSELNYGHFGFGLNSH